MSTPLEPLPSPSYADFATTTTEPQTIDADNPPWSVLGAAAIWVFSVALIIATPLIFLAPYLQQKHIGLDTLPEFVTTDKTAIFLQIISIIPAHLLTLAAAWAMVTRFGKHPFLGTLGWQWDRGFTFWRCTALAVGLLGVGLVLIHFFGGAETQLEKIINSSRATAFTTAFLATATAPLVEEIVYRGLLYSALRRAIGAAWSVVIVLSLFALIHVPQYWPNIGVIATIGILSLVLTVVRAYTRKLLPCFIIHLIFNGIQSFTIVLEPVLKRYYPDEGQGALLVYAFARLFQLTY
ncbi:MAG: CPBP family intramembrane metalloprotease [Acidobacteria bacterium]|nr:CPBP family intramembrane metalloprotease [Acidobacteriota bacterium]